MNIIKLSKNEITNINKLYLQKYRNETNTFIALGPHLAIEAKNSGFLIKSYTTDSNYDGILISTDDMRKIARTDTPTKVLSICTKKEKHNLTNKLLILDSIQDPGNMGTLLRTAVAFGFETIILGDGSVDIYNEKVIRSTQGAIFKLNFIRANILDFIVNNNDYIYFGTDVRNGIDISKLEVPTKFALILGNEGQGIKGDILEKTNANIYIPMHNTESLNVSVCGGILMYLLAK